VVLGQIRAAELTAEAFERNLLEPLDADLALCVRAGEEPSPLYDRAKHLWLLEESGDWAEMFDRFDPTGAWRDLLPISNQMLGGVEDSEYPQIGSSGILFYYREFLRRSIERDGVLGSYDWLILTRSDFLWPSRHPDLRLLSDKHVYALDGEEYGGICDRHLIVPARYFEPFLRVADPVFTEPHSLRRRIEKVAAREEWFLVNTERHLALRLRELGLWRKTRFLPYIPYTVRAEGGPTNWSTGEFDRELGYCIKYPPERERSEIARRFVSDDDSWRRYLAPVRGARQRRRLRNEYRAGGLYARTFRRRDPLLRVLRLLARGAGRAAASVRRGTRHIAAVVDRAAARLGLYLRRAPGMSDFLDARVRRIEQRARQG
jgi:hypothetical protein